VRLLPTGEAALKEIVLEPNLDRRLRRVAVSTSNTKKNNAPFRHLLLHGPPGTGNFCNTRDVVFYINCLKF
jgi:Holliday junction resolvasome RuvABC ATP-dependent DNA helicase subunit